MREAIKVSTVDLSGLTWRKSSRSGANGDNDNCVEVAFAWRKSSRSGVNGDNDACVEVAFSGPVVAMRDSKNPSVAMVLPSTAFSALLRAEYVAP